MGRRGRTRRRDRAGRTAPLRPGIRGALGSLYLHPLGRGVRLGGAHLQPGVQALLQERPGLRRPAAVSHGCARAATPPVPAARRADRALRAQAGRREWRPDGWGPALTGRGLYLALG